MADQPNQQDLVPSPDPTKLTTDMGDKVEARVRDFTEREIAHLDQQWRTELAALRREMDIMFAAAKQAIDKAEVATEKRFAGVNEWRDQSADRERSMAEQTAMLTSTFLPREVFDAQFAELRRGIVELTEKVNKVV